MSLLETNPLFVHNVNEHQVHKNKLINFFKLIPQNKLETVSHSDWNLSNDIKKNWIDYFYQNVFLDFKINFYNNYNENIVLLNTWFQWYEKGDLHDWHIHGDCHFTNIYYLNLPNKDTKTCFKNEKQLNIKEGQIISFPSYWKHSSPINKFKEPKIIISFNSNIL